MRSMLYEVSSYPPPGLISPFNSDARRDMDFFTFLNSIPSLSYYLTICAKTGLSEDRTDRILLKLLRLGIQAEQRMYRVTGSVNTQKG